jgi:adenosylmethionine-8-amino-7-oxononanoate aminotransferase
MRLVIEMNRNIWALYQSFLVQAALPFDKRYLGQEIEFVADSENKTRFEACYKVGANMSAAYLNNGLIARAIPYGDILGFLPPLITTREDMSEIAGFVRKPVPIVCDERLAAGVI